MFRKVISSLAVMLCAFTISASAQNIKAHCISARNITLSSVTPPRNPMTSKIDPQGTEFWGGYWNGKADENLTIIGMGNVPEVYDLAICYPAGSAEVSGLTMEGLRFSFPSAENITDVKIWMSTTVPATPDKADITVQDVTAITDIQNTADPFVEVRFDNPYTVDPTKDLYIGYSFKVTGGTTENDEYPVLVYYTADIPNSFLLKYGGENGTWMDYSQYGLGRLALQVLMSGTLPENGATIKNNLGSYTEMTGSQITVPLSIQSAGTNAVESMDLSVELNGEVTYVHIVPATPLVGIGTKYDYDLTVNMPAQTGSYQLDIDIQKVNGVDNQSAALAAGRLYAIDRTVERIPYVEEFTAMWCGNCPRGFVGLQKLRQDYGSKISLAAVHSGDAMDCNAEYKEILANVTGFPLAYIDRYYLNADPYYGYTTPYGIKDLVESAKEIKPLAQLYAYAQIEGDKLTAKSETEFLYTGDASDFATAYVLTEDGQHNDTWRQANFYSGETDSEVASEPLFEYWINEGKFVKGVIYDDVVIAARGIARGVEGSIPSQVTEGEKYIYSVDFDLTQYPVIQNRDNLKLIVLLIDKKSGMIVNSNFVPINVETSVAGIRDDVTVRETSRYTADGRMITAPHKGISIIRYSDGSVKKVIEK